MTTKPIYHFLDARWAVDDLARFRLKISRVDDLNDPFELLAAELKDSDVRKAFQQLRSYMCAKRGVICFSRAWHNPLLWSHYGDKHRGICLGFEVPKVHIERMRYDSKRLVDVVPKLLKSGPDSEVLMRRLLATKFRDWKYEDEVRVHTDLKDVDSVTGHYFKDFGSDMALREVILGFRFSGSTAKIKTLAQACASGVSIIQARLAFTSFRVVRDKRGVVV